MATIYKFFCFFYLWASFIGFQCKSTHHISSENAQYKSIYINQFKLTYFRQLLLKGFNNSKPIRDLIAFDQSGFTESILATDDFKLIDSFTTIDNFKMKMDSANGVGMVAEGAEGKHPLGFILSKLNSKWLESLASNRYKIAKNNNALPSY
jgi:hypothetical protein